MKPLDLLKEHINETFADEVEDYSKHIYYSNFYFSIKEGMFCTFLVVGSILVK